MPRPRRATRPARGFENVETGVRLLEKAFQEIGPEGTEEEFNRVLGRSVSTDTERSDKNDHGFEMVRNSFFAGKGIGRDYVLRILPSARLRTSTVSEVLSSNYGQQREEAKRKEAERKKKTAADKAGPETTRR